MSIKREQKLMIFLFLLIPLVHLIILSYIPIGFNVLLGFTSWDGVQELGKMKFIGLRNYKKIFTDPQYIALFKNCLWYILVSIPQLLLSFVLAIIINGKFKGLNIFKGILIFPYLLNGIIVSTVFILFYNPTGTLNLLLGFFNLNFLQKNWLQQLNIVNPSIASISIWRYYGLSFLMFYGSLQAIPEEIYDASAIDGCNKWSQIRYILIPYIRKVLFINMLLSISGSIQVFEIPYIMMRGSNGTSTPVIQIQQSMRDGKIGFAAALSVIVFFVVITSVTVQKAIFKEEA